MNSKEKDEYEYIEGSIVYLDKELGALPVRNKGLYRYLIIDTYPYPFEIYADQQAKKIDSLKIADNVRIFFYETDNTHAEDINRYIQFLERGDDLYFQRTNTARALGYSLIGMSLLLILFAYGLWKYNKIIF